MGYACGSYTTGTGLIASQSTTTLTGNGTTFTTEVAAGDEIVIGTQMATVISITDNTHLTIEVGITFSPAPNNTAYSIFHPTTLPVSPKSQYAPGGERAITGSGQLTYQGYARVVWTFAWLTVAQWGSLKDLLAGGGFSGTGYVITRTDEDVWALYRAISRFPEPEQLKRWGGGYEEVEIELVLVQELAT
jgi:hypothetical protein